MRDKGTTMVEAAKNETAQVEDHVSLLENGVRAEAERLSRAFDRAVRWCRP
jgi:hypothetical protein